MIGKTNANGFTGSEEESVIDYDKLPFSYIGNITNIVKNENVVIIVPSNTTVIFVSYDNGNTFEEVVFSENIADVIYSKIHGFYFALSVLVRYLFLLFCYLFFLLAARHGFRFVHKSCKVFYDLDERQFRFMRFSI